MLNRMFQLEACLICLSVHIWTRTIVTMGYLGTSIPANIATVFS